MAEFSAFYTEWAERSGNDSMMPIVPWQDLSQDHARHSDRHSFVRKVWWVHMRPGSTVSRTRVTKKKKTNSQFRVVCQCIDLPLYYTHHTSFTTSKHIGKYQYIYIYTHDFIRINPLDIPRNRTSRSTSTSSALLLRVRERKRLARFSSGCREDGFEVQNILHGISGLDYWIVAQDLMFGLRKANNCNVTIIVIIVIVIVIG